MDLDAANAIDYPMRDFEVDRWRVHLVFPGDRYGATGSLVYDPADADEFGMGLPMVEFYDLEARERNPLEWPVGQFVTRYYMSTLMNLDGRNPECAAGEGLEHRNSLVLDGGVPSWRIDGAYADIEMRAEAKRVMRNASFKDVAQAAIEAAAQEGRLRRDDGKPPRL